MIYQLMKRDPACQAVAFMALISAVVCILYAASPNLPFPYCFIAAMGALMSRAHQRATRFQAGLPIAGRQLFLARLCSLIAMLWLSAIAGAAAILVAAGFAHSASALTVVEVAAIGTVMIATLQSLRLRELVCPKWLMFVVLFLVILGGPLATMFLPAAPLLVVCALLTTALLIRTWMVIPPSFQIAPARASAGPAPRAVADERSQVHGSRAPAIAWLPVLRSVGTQPRIFALFFYPWLFFATMLGQWIPACFLVMLAWLTASNKSRWLWALPIRPRTLLLAGLTPIFLPLIAGYFAGVLVRSYEAPGLDLRMQILNLAAIIGWTLLAVLFTEFLGWRRFRGISPTVREGVVFVLMIIPVASIALVRKLPMGFDTLAQNVLLRVSSALPGNLLAPATAAALLVAALYWVVEKVFRESEFVCSRPAPQDE